MAGKGRGVAAFTFNIEALGIGRGSMPEARVGPSPLYPNTEFKPVPLKVGEDEDYMLALKQEMRGTMQRLPHNIKVQSNRAGELSSQTYSVSRMDPEGFTFFKFYDLEKYTERYLKQRQIEDERWTPDWNLFPKELMPRTKKPRTKDTKNKKTGKSSDKAAAADVLSKLDELAKKDDGNVEKSDDEAEKKKDEDDEEIQEEEYDEQDLEEDNDYIENYFDNGEDFAADSDENMDGEATY